VKKGQFYLCKSKFGLEEEYEGVVGGWNPRLKFGTDHVQHIKKSALTENHQHQSSSFQ